MTMSYMTIYYLILLAIMNWVVYSLVTEFRRAEGTLFERLIKAAMGSATILWSRFVVFVSAAASVLVGAADAMNLPEVKQTIQTYLTPEHTALLLICIAVLTEMFRKRTLPRE